MDIIGKGDHVFYSLDKENIKEGYVLVDNEFEMIVGRTNRCRTGDHLSPSYINDFVTKDKNDLIRSLQSVHRRNIEELKQKIKNLSKQREKVEMVCTGCHKVEKYDPEH